LIPLETCPICGQPHAVPCPGCHQSVSQDDSAGVPTLHVRLSAGQAETEIDLSDTLASLAVWSVNHPQVAITLDMAEVPFLGSRTLAVLIRLNRTQKSASRRLKLLNVGADLGEIFRITRMDQLVELVPA
jgi:anti-anti-sigma factor